MHDNGFSGKGLGNQFHVSPQPVALSGKDCQEETTR